MKTIILDPGHGGNDPGAVANGLQEKNLNLIIALACREELKKYNCKVVMTRTSDVTVSLADRKIISNNNKADLFVAFHNNAHSNIDARGFESFVFDGQLHSSTINYRDIVHNEVYSYIKTLGAMDRGKKRANFYVLREPSASCMLLEYLFLTNVADANLLKNNVVLQEFGRRTAIGIAKALSLPTLVVSGTPIVNKSVPLAQIKQWAKNKGAHQRFIDIADLYYKYSQLTGINLEFIYAQSAHETGFGKFTGNVVPEQNNWAGIKTKNASGDTRDDHEWFISPEDGVRAHFNHISAYLGLQPVGQPHGRYYVVLTTPWAGTIRYVEELSGKYAPASTYHTKIIQYMKEILVTKVEEPTTPPPISNDPLPKIQRRIGIEVNGKWSAEVGYLIGNSTYVRAAFITDLVNAQTTGHGDFIRIKL